MSPRLLARNLRYFTLVTIFGACANGCTLFDEVFDDSVSLKEFAPIAAHVTAELTGISRSQLVLEGKEGVCPTIADDIAADVDGKPMDVFIKGGKQPSGKGWICGQPTFRRNVATTEMGETSTKFVVDDDTGTVTVIATDLLLKRSITPSANGNAPVMAGVESSFDWSVPTDVLDADFVKADFEYDDPALSFTAEITVRVEGSLVFIRLPTDAPTGTGKLQLDVTADVPVEKCEGVPACTASVHTLVTVPLDVSAANPPNP